MRTAAYVRCVLYCSSNNVLIHKLVKKIVRDDLLGFGHETSFSAKRNQFNRVAAVEIYLWKCVVSAKDEILKTVWKNLKQFIVKLFETSVNSISVEV